MIPPGTGKSVVAVFPRCCPRGHREAPLSLSPESLYRLQAAQRTEGEFCVHVKRPPYAECIGTAHIPKASRSRESLSAPLHVCFSPVAALLVTEGQAVLLLGWHSARGVPRGKPVGGGTPRICVERGTIPTHALF